ncbi:MAG TPA: ribose 5-phosphate isomerase B [Nannocystis exedens]|nr:ribose 5-phosphate isomerase B [Nannocystis exedens]
MRIYLGSDHGGIELRALLAEALCAAGHEIMDIAGPALPGVSVDYPDVAFEVCQRVRGGHNLGILICGTGQGMAMAANKIQGIRAAVVSDCFSAAMAREHNDANVLCLGQRVLGTELAKRVTMVFLGAQFAGGRHARRVAKIDAAGGS